MGYVVVGAYVTAPVSSDQGTVILGFDRGAVLPGSVPEETIAHLIDVKLVEEAEDLAEAGVEVYPAPNVTAPVGTVLPEGEVAIGLPLPVVAEETTTVNSAQADQEQAADTPAGNASKEAWVEYAVSRGMPRDEAEDSTRDELRDKYQP